MSEVFVQIKGVQKILKKQVIIQDLNVQVAQGQILALCGGNGAGKSTILRMIAGILQPDQGDITVGGLRWKDNRKRFAELIGYMPDDYRFSAGLTAKETMTFWAKLRGLTEQRAAEVLAEVGLEETGTKPVSSFSKGMRQRILFAQALLSRSPLLVMDEPTNGLDPYWMETFVQLVHKAAANGQTVLFSTHQLQIAEVLADHIVFLRGGSVELEGTGEEIRGQLGSTGLQDAFAELFGITSKRK
ncbi:ABC transporter ATP-binding protein [Paenibacillus eucommiae]|uniref:ABC-type multidrug transport system ATPase subunit n=1 Tax=Paenibacillus eucommiae TaxID=1355755 RepID=A0ABS4IPN8_9BACL|nr:ABC transporter ATP-binding protein [Paenibacillus eucommiae]MBP1989520.1 ABC-type multidrug transport system ATPase subunit [Paenibacillus eucommiae]